MLVVPVSQYVVLVLVVPVLQSGLGAGRRCLHSLVLVLVVPVSQSVVLVLVVPVSQSVVLVLVVPVSQSGLSAGRSCLTVCDLSGRRVLLLTAAWCAFGTLGV